jgi:uncharacterized damage-inducible protein DinB
MSGPISVPDTRTRPSPDLDERETAIAFLDWYRQLILVKLDGLDRDALTRRLVPSLTTLLGIVKHLALVEWWWFAVVFGGEPLDPAEADEETPDSDWILEDSDTPEQLVAAYRAACTRSDEIARAAASLDDRSPGPHRPGITLRWILVHMVEETARHAGHADIIRELIDNRTGF